MKTNELRELVRTLIVDAVEEFNIKEVYYNQADVPAVFPHIVFTLTGTNLQDLSRKDYELDIDIYTKGTSFYTIEDVADTVEAAFDAKNLPQDGILPTTYLETKRLVADEDKTIQHELIRIIIQLYDI